MWVEFSAGEGGTPFFACPCWIARNKIQDIESNSVKTLPSETAIGRLAPPHTCSTQVLGEVAQPADLMSASHCSVSRIMFMKMMGGSSVKFSVNLRRLRRTSRLSSLSASPW